MSRFSGLLNRKKGPQYVKRTHIAPAITAKVRTAVGNEDVDAVRTIICSMYDDDLLDKPPYDLEFEQALVDAYKLFKKNGVIK